MSRRTWTASTRGSSPDRLPCRCVQRSGSARPSADQATLRALLTRGAEASDLDVKEAYPEGAPGKLHLVKDIAAMAVKGGYIVVGVRERDFEPIGLSDEAAQRLDASNVRQQIRRYLGDDVPVASAQHTVDGNLVVLLAIGPHPDGLVVLADDGRYPDGTYVFRRGQAYWRDGPTNVPVTQKKLRSLLAEARDAARAAESGLDVTVAWGSVG